MSITAEEERARIAEQNLRLNPDFLSDSCEQGKHEDCALVACPCACRHGRRMAVTADEVRRLIIDHDAGRPRSQQTHIGPSDLSSPCDRKLVYQLSGVPRVVPNDVNLYAYVGTGIHRQMERACKAHNRRTRHGRWLTEVAVSVPVTAEVNLTGSCDAYDADTFTACDWKSRGTSKPSAAARDKHHTQILPYGLGLILAGHRVEHTAVVYIPRNGLLSEIEVDSRPFDHDAAEALLRRYEQLLTVAKAGPAVLPLIPTADDCTFCPWWNPNAWIDGAGCAGHQAQQTPGVLPVEHNNATTTETRTAS